MPSRARPLSRSQLAFESLLEREDDGQDPVQLPPRGQRTQTKKDRGGGGRDVLVLDECDVAERRRSAASSSAAPAAPAAASHAPTAAFDELQSRFPGAPRDLLSDVLGASSGGVEEAAEALRSLGLVAGAGGEEEKTEEEEANNNPSVPPPPPVPRTPAMLTEGLWGGLPPDMQRLIYARLGPRDAARAALSCREFAARARAARARPLAVEVAAPRASLRAIEGQVAAFRAARSVSLARWRLHLDAFEAGNAAGAAAEAASAAAQQGRHWQRRAWQQQLQQHARSSSSSSSSSSSLPPQLRVADPERVLEAIEAALAAVARGSARRAKLVESSARASGGGSSNGGGGGQGGGEDNPFYLPTLDASCSEAAEVEHLTFPRLSHSNGNGNGSSNSSNSSSTGDCSLPLEHCERLARRAAEVLPGLRSVRFDDVGGGDGPRGLCRGLCRQTEDSAGLEESDEDDEDKDEDEDDGAPSCALHSIAITGASSLDEESVRALLRSWSSAAAPNGKKSRRRQQQQQQRELVAVDFSRCPLLTSAAFSWPPRLAPSDRPVLRRLRSVTLDGCRGLERFELNNGTFPSLERLSLRDCRRLAEIVIDVASPPGRRQQGSQTQLVELRVSGCAALRSIGAPSGRAPVASASMASASLPLLERLVAAGCASLVALPARPSPVLVEANFFGCRSLTSSALEAFLGTGETAAEAAAAEATAAAGAAAPPSNLSGSRLASLNLNGCVSLSRIRLIVSPALQALDASGCRSCVEVELGGCSAESLRSLRLDGCRALSRLSLPGEPGRRGGFVVSGSGGSGGGVVSVAFLDPAATSAAGVPEEVAALVAAATVKKAKKAKKKKEAEV